MSCGESKVVCVTGASGFMASWLVKLLLQRGFTVKATVRDQMIKRIQNTYYYLTEQKIGFICSKQTLLEEGSFDTAIDGRQCVFHTASPVLLSVTDPQAELIDPALKGTLNVHRSCANTPSIKRVVITSSIVSVMFNGKPLSPDVTVDETWFSDQAFCEKSKLWYPFSKILAEEAAWKFAKENRIDMATIHPEIVLSHHEGRSEIFDHFLKKEKKIHPGIVIGPFLQPTGEHKHGTPSQTRKW